MTLAEKFWTEQFSVNTLSCLWFTLKNFIEKLKTLVWGVFLRIELPFLIKDGTIAKKVESSIKMKRANEKFSDNHRYINISFQE